MSKNIKTWPEQIYLQVNDEDHELPLYDEMYNDGITWCADSIVKCEVLYVRADLVAKKDAEIAELRKDAERLNFVLANYAFLQESETDLGSIAYQLLTQDEDENYIVLSGEGGFFSTTRKAIDAAIAAEKEQAK